MLAGFALVLGLLEIMLGDELRSARTAAIPPPHSPERTPNLPTLLAKIPDEFKPLAALFIGASLLVFLVLFHGACLHGILVLHKRRVRRLRAEKPQLVRALLLFGWAVFLALVLHIVGFAMWAGSVLFLGLIRHPYDAIYFSANAYTTLGFGNVDLEAHWRNISPIIGISGLFTFAWTTSALASVVTTHGQLIEQLEDEREREMQMRFALRKDAWAAMQTERSVEQSEKEKIKSQVAGASFFQRRKIWRNERKRVRQLRAAKLAEIAELRRKERQEEAKLVPSQ
jgi:hypothetical protein